MKLVVSSAGLSLWTLVAAAAGPPFLGNGIKIGEVTAGTAVIWARLTETPNCKPPQFKQPGATGEVRLTVKEEAGDGVITRTAGVDPRRDFTHQFVLTGLKPATAYQVSVTPGDAEDRSVRGRFTTAAAPDRAARVVFTVTTGHKFKTIDDPGRGQKIYPAMLALEPSFFVHTGDIVYYDGDLEPMGATVGKARLHWHRMYSLPNQIAFHRQTPSYFIKDDHDTLKNDCWPGQTYGELTFEEGRAIFREQVPMGGKTYRTIRWGKDLQVWLPEGRDFRSPNTMPDGPDKTIWGGEQIAWFKRTVEQSDATFRILVSPTPVVGPDRARGKNDNHANAAFRREGDMLRRFLAGHDMIVCSGDRHWQYHSVDAETGLMEFCCGPSTNRHAGGWNPDKVTSEHRFLRVRGGFLSVTVERIDGTPTAAFRHHDVDGKSVNEVRLTR